MKVKRNDFITNNINLGNGQHNQTLTELTKPQHNAPRNRGCSDAAAPGRSWSGAEQSREEQRTM